METELYDVIRETEESHWWYVGRRRLVFDVLARILPEYQRPRVLDIGCGTGFNLQTLRALGVRDGIGLDISSRALSHCRTRGIPLLVQGDFARIPFQANTFDVVLALDVIEHIQDDRGALNGLIHLLRPGGRLILFTPAFSFLWSAQDRVSHHYRRYTAPELRAKLDSAGYRIEKLSYANTMLFPIVWAGRMWLKASGQSETVKDENHLHPAWSNGLLTGLFSMERPLLRRWNLPFGVSLLAVAARPRT
jgi:SAM-dependent methyltransferase